MTVNNELDINTLTWVKSEIDDTMKQARTSLESYIEDQNDESQILFCINYLHQVYGTLQMVELYGASLLAEELELLAKAIHENKVKNKEEAFEVLIRGSLKLPDYLEKLQAGQKDTPIVLLPLFNDMRAARSEALLSETSLFNPDLAIEAPAVKDKQIIPTKHIAELAKEKRHQFHLGLLGWFKNKDTNKSLGLIENVLGELRKVAEEQNTSRMLWVAEGLVESLKQKGVEASVAVKSLVGQVDRTIKQIIDGGEVALAIEPPNELLKNLLYYVASSSSDGVHTKEVKESFNLADVMPDTRTLEKARADLNAPNMELMDTVSGVLREDLQQVKDSLDIYMRSDDKNAEILKPVSEKLTSMADTLGMLSLGPQRKSLISQIEIINGLIDGSRQADANELMEMASIIIGIEQTLDSMSETTTQLDDDTEPSITRRQPKTAEQRKLLESVVAEAKIDIGAVKESVSDFSRQLNHPEVLNSVPPLLDKVRGSLNILQLDRAADLLATCKEFVETKLIPSKTIPEADTLDYLADTISSIEYYMESLVDSWGEPTAILNVAATSLEQLGKSMETEKPTVRDPNTSLDAINIPASDVNELTDDTIINLHAPSEEEMAAMNEGVEKTLNNLQQPDFDEPDTLVEMPQPELTEDRTVEDTIQNLQQPELQPEDMSEPMELDLGAQLDVDETAQVQDADSLTLEIDEPQAATANEALERLDEAMGLWFMDPESTDVSGLVLEVVKSIEESIDSSAHADVFKIVSDMQQTIQRIANKEEVFGDETQKSLMWARDELDKYFSGADASVTESIEVATAEEPAEAGLGDAEALSGSDVTKPAKEEYVPPVEIDEEIFDIFLEEAEEEYENITRLLPEWKSNLENTEALKEMRRSFHTLKGSGRLVGANDLGEFAWAFENMLNRVLDNTISATPELLDLVERGRASLPGLYQLLKDGNRPDQQIFSLMEHADSLSRGESFTPLTETISSVSIPQPDLSRLDIDSSDSVELEIGFDESLDKISRPEIDSVLLEIYRKEVATHLATVREFISDWHEKGQHEVSEPLFRALHTLTGSARTTGVSVVSNLCLQIEHYIKLLQTENMPVSEEGIALLEEAANRIDGICAQLGEDGKDLYNTEDLIEKFENLFNNLQQSVAEEHKEQSIAEGSDLNTMSAEIELSDEDEYDEELLEIFIEEGSEILEESDHTLQDWIKEPDNTEHVEALQRQLHTLKGGARMSGVSAIGDLSHRVESLITNIVDGSLEISDDIFSMLQNAQDSLVNMLEQLKERQEISSGQNIIDDIDRLMGGSTEDTEETVPDTTPDDTSDELVLTGEDEITLDTHSLELEAAEENDLSIDLELDSDVSESKPESNDLSIELTEELSSLADDLNEMTATDADIPMLDISDEAEEEDVDKTEQIQVDNNFAKTDSIQQDEATPLDNVPVATEQQPDSDLLTPEQESAPVPKTGPVEQVRVRADTLNNLVNFAGEVSIYRSRLEQQVNSFRFNLQELDETVERFRGQLRKFEIESEAQIQTRKEETRSSEHEHFDPLEFDRFTQMQQISRSMLESMNDIDSLRSILAGLNRESETLLVQQSRVNTELQEGLMSTRLVPFEKQVNRLKRIVRQTSNEVGKLTGINFNGVDLELDRTIVERMMPPIEHMLRNAIAHGIEKPEQRKASGKNEQGSIHFSMAREGGDIVIQIADDGAGIDLEAIRNKAIEKGLIREDTKISQKALLDLILESGFSTAEEVTQIAGRGVGMDVVNNEIKQLGGVLNIETSKGKGTTFTVSMPLSLAVSRALMVYVGESMYAVPLLSVEGVERVSHEELVRLQSEPDATYPWIGEEFPYIHLGQLLDGATPSLPGEGQKSALLMVRSGNYRAAIHIEGLVGSREIVIKPVGPQLSSLRGVAGATIMGDGSVVLILDLGVLIRLALTSEETTYLEPPVEDEEEVAEDKTPVVMVVDDSITVRKVTSRFLERNDLEVVQAKDGVDALTQLLDVIPDVMLLDVEMPRMDGFELAINMRNDERLKDIPIIMITSRTGQKHRDRAMNIGVNMYMGKPYNEGELLDNIHSLLEVKHQG